MNVQQMLRLGLLTLFGMSAIALIIHFFSDTVDISRMILGGLSWWNQLLIGAVYGVVAGLLARFLVGLKFMEPVRTKYERLFKDFDLDTSQIWFISFCAGVGEELLFRGALQPLLGIPITSVIFVAIHGYLNPLNWRLSIYGIVMTIIIALMGWMAQTIGLLTAISAHIIIDVVLLSALFPAEQEEIENT